MIQLSVHPTVTESIECLEHCSGNGQRKFTTLVGHQVLFHRLDLLGGLTAVECHFKWVRRCMEQARLCGWR